MARTSNVVGKVSRSPDAIPQQINLRPSIPFHTLFIYSTFHVFRATPFEILGEHGILPYKSKGEAF